jgi:hypothetical protein
MEPNSTRRGFLTVTNLNDFNGPAQTTNLVSRLQFKYRSSHQRPAIRKAHEPET